MLCFCAGDMALAKDPVKTYPRVEYKKLPQFKHIDKQIDSLLFGLIVEVNPKFDPYGNEIRRFMVDAGNGGIVTNVKEREDQYNNVLVAQQVLRNWRKDMGKRIAEIERRISREPVYADELRSQLIDMLPDIDRFFSVTEKWLDANLDLIEFLRLTGGKYSAKANPDYLSDQESRDTFQKLILRRNKYRDAIRQYPSFRYMEY